jgi:hypothetical protein
MDTREAELTVAADVPADVVPLRAVGLDVRVDWSHASLEFGTEGEWARRRIARR